MSSDSSEEEGRLSSPISIVSPPSSPSRTESTQRVSTTTEPTTGIVSRPSLEERFIQQHRLRPQGPTVRVARQTAPLAQIPSCLGQPLPPQVSNISSRQPPRSGPPVPMTPWLGDSAPAHVPGWQPNTFQPWLSPADVDKYRASFLSSSTSFPGASPSSSSSSASSSAFTRPGLSSSSHGSRDFMQTRPVQPGFDRPLGFHTGSQVFNPSDLSRSTTQGKQ